ncbi:MAG TPA: hypothetical protein VJK48_03985 [Chlamydiales bacterium]|nr:hypothetical protein [Chlamydiales bacterium]
MSLSMTPQSIESRETWRNEYHPICLDPLIIRHWKLAEDVRSPEEILKILDNCLKPLLPEGHIWSSTEEKIEILRHKAQNRSDFKIHLFGPDQKNRIGYLVVDLKEKEPAPLFGYAMTKKEGFPKNLRNKYPQASSYFKAGEENFWRGHIIDYHDTLGSPEEESSLSTSFAPNYKPEPEGAWSNTIRKEIVKDLRDIEGSYSELILYNFEPARTDMEKKIPESVLLSTFTWDKQYLTSYHVPKEHACHGWQGKVKAKTNRLSVDIFFSPLFANINFSLQNILGKEPTHLNALESYELLRNAEMEYSEATYKMQYLLFAKSQNAPKQILKLWLKRSLLMAYNVTIAFQGHKPPFPQSLMNRLKTAWDPEASSFKYVQQLGDIAYAILRRESPNELAINFKKEKDCALSSIITEIICISPKSKQYSDMVEKIEEAISEGSSMHIKKVTSEIAAKIFPEISQKARKRSSKYMPVLRVEASSKTWEKKIEALTIEHFGEGIFVPGL